MGGCCCCSSRGVEISSAPAYYYYPTASDERVPLSFNGGGASAVSTGLLVNTNLEVSIPDAYRPPPAPMPFDAVLGTSQTPSLAQGMHDNKIDEAEQTTNVDSSQENVAVNTLEICIKSEDAKELDCKAQAGMEIESPEELEVELSKPIDPFVPTKEEEEEVCPTCLEEYDAENPKIVTKCEHHFHLACILEWMERSDTCPVCDKKLSEPLGSVMMTSRSLGALSDSLASDALKVPSEITFYQDSPDIMAKYTCCKEADKLLYPRSHDLDFISCFDALFSQHFIRLQSDMSPLVSAQLEGAYHWAAIQSQEVPPTPGQPVTEPTFIPVAVGLLDSTGKDMP